MDLNNTDKKLIKVAKNIIDKRNNNKSSVGCALITNKNNIYTGVNIHTESAPCSICSEYAAIGTMYSKGETKIKTIVAVTVDNKIIPPCGQCMEFIFDVTNKDKNVEVIINNKTKILLRELYTHPWEDIWHHNNNNNNNCKIK